MLDWFYHLLGFFQQDAVRNVLTSFTALIGVIGWGWGLYLWFRGRDVLSKLTTLTEDNQRLIFHNRALDRKVDNLLEGLKSLPSLVAKDWHRRYSPADQGQMSRVLGTQIGSKREQIRREALEALERALNAKDRDPEIMFSLHPGSTLPQGPIRAPAQTPLQEYHQASQLEDLSDEEPTMPADYIEERAWAHIAELAHRIETKSIRSS